MNWHTKSQGPKKKCAHFTRERIHSCSVDTARNKGSFTSIALWSVQSFFSPTVCTIQTIYETWSINHRRGKFLSIIFEFLTWKMVAFLLKSRANFSSVKQTKKRNRSVEACRCTTCFWNVLIGFPNPFYGSQLRFITSKLISGGLLYCLLIYTSCVKNHYLNRLSIQFYVMGRFLVKCPNTWFCEV